MWDPKGLMFRWLRYCVVLHWLSFVRGYLHVFVHTGVRQQWCRWPKFDIYCNTLSLSANNTYYVAPIPLGQAPVQVVAYQPPPGYALVPMAEVRQNPLLKYQILTTRKGKWNPLDIKVLSSQNLFSFSSSKQLGTHLPLPHMRRQLLEGRKSLENYYPRFGRLNHLCLLLTALTVPSIDVYKM